MLDDMTAAATSLDFFDAMAMSLVFLFDFGFLFFFGRVLLSVIPFDTGPVAFGARLKAFLGPNVGAMKLSGRRTASLRPSGGGSRTNGAETLGDAILGNCDEFGRAAWRSGKAVFPGELGSKHLVDSFCIGRVGKGASRYVDVFVVTNPESARESGFRLSVCGLVDILAEVNPEWDSWAGVGIEVWSWG